MPWRLREASFVPSSDHNPFVPGPNFTNSSKELDDLRVIVLESRDLQPDLTAHRQVCIFPSNDQLDPFLPLAGTVTRRDQCLLHHYLTITPAVVYGASKNTEDFVVRNLTVRFVQMKSTWRKQFLLECSRKVVR